MSTLKQLANGLRSGKKKYSRVTALEGGPFRKGVIFRLDIISPRKPNSARRQIAKVRILYNMKRVFCHIPGIRPIIHIFAIVIVKGRPKGKTDSPGIHFSLVKGLLDFDQYEAVFRNAKRSKFGVKKWSKEEVAMNKWQTEINVFYE